MNILGLISQLIGIKTLRLTVYDVSGTLIINKHSSGDESCNGQCDDKSVVIWLVDISCVVFTKRDHLVVHLHTLPWPLRDQDVISLPSIGFPR